MLLLFEEEMWVTDHVRFHSPEGQLKGGGAVEGGGLPQVEVKVQRWPRTTC